VHSALYEASEPQEMDSLVTAIQSVCGIWQSKESGQCNKRTAVSSGRKK